MSVENFKIWLTKFQNLTDKISLANFKIWLAQFHFNISLPNFITNSVENFTWKFDF